MNELALNSFDQSKHCEFNWGYFHIIERGTLKNMLPTEEQLRGLCEMLHRALLELRILGWEGKAAQAADLADAFHELPIVMISQTFNWEILRSFLETYQNRYPRQQPVGSGANHFDYLALLEEILSGKSVT